MGITPRWTTREPWAACGCQHWEPRLPCDGALQLGSGVCKPQWQHNLSAPFPRSLAHRRWLYFSNWLRGDLVQVRKRGREGAGLGSGVAARQAGLSYNP